MNLGRTQFFLKTNKTAETKNLLGFTCVSECVCVRARCSSSILVRMRLVHSIAFCVTGSQRRVRALEYNRTSAFGLDH